MQINKSIPFNLSVIPSPTCENPGSGTFQELHRIRWKKRKQEQITPAYKLADSVREHVVHIVVSRQHMRVRKSDGGHHRTNRQIFGKEA